MQLSENVEIFSALFIAFLESALNFEHLKKKEPLSSSISEVNDCQRSVYSNA